MTEVVVTGIGCVTPIGTGVEGLWSGLRAKRSVVRTITHFDPAPFKSRIAGEIDDFRPQDHLPAKAAKRMDRFSGIGVVSSLLALEDALQRLEQRAPEQARIVQLRFFVGLTEAEVADVMGVSERTVRRERPVAARYRAFFVAPGAALNLL